MSTAWILILVGYWNDEKNEKKGYLHILFWINMLFNYQITCLFIVALTCILKVSQLEDISLFPEAQLLTILWASSRSLPFYLKVDWTASGAIFTSFFCLLLGPSRLNWWPFALDFQRCCLEVHLASITLISWVLSLAFSWCWNVIYLFTVVINWRVQGLSCETNNHYYVL